MPISPSDGAILTVDRLTAGYGEAMILHDVALRVQPNRIVAIIGPNGSGKSTLMKVLAGDLKPREGSVCFRGKDVTATRQDRLAALGIAYLRQEREVYASLSVQENLQAGGFLLRKRDVAAAMERVYNRFPFLAERRGIPAGRLSGGERKMLALGRLLMTSPTLVLLDEPSAGLAPAVSAKLLQEQMPALIREGASVILVEQRAKQALRCADWAYMLAGGRVMTAGPARQLLESDNLVATLLGQRAGAPDQQLPASP